MKIFSCENHIEQALDECIESLEVYPIMRKVNEKEKLSTKCSYCDNAAIYIVANK